MKIEKLTALKASREARPGFHNDGAGLYLQVSPTGTKSWVLRFKMGGSKQSRWMGLGSVNDFGLAEARQRAKAARQLLADGIDPIDARRERLARAAVDIAKALTFQQCAERCIEDRRAGWKNAKHAQQWENTLSTYAFPHIGDLPVAAVDTGMVRRCLDPIWTTKTETASRVRQRIETVLDWAKVHGYRTGDNPAAWRGHLEGVLPAPGAVAKAANHAALPYPALPAFVAALRAHQGIAAIALEFTVLTAARTGETILATWAEFDFDTKTWTVPSERMKASIAHTVPLSAPALALLEKMADRAGKDASNVNADDWVFPGAIKGRPLSSMAMLELVRGMGTTDEAGAPITVHGMRSTFRQWAAEQTTHPREIAEHALAHRLPDKVEAAYQRSTMVDKRRALMADWGAYATGSVA